MHRALGADYAGHAPSKADQFVKDSTRCLTPRGRVPSVRLVESPTLYPKGNRNVGMADVWEVIIPRSASPSCLHRTQRRGIKKTALDVATASGHFSCYTTQPLTEISARTCSRLEESPAPQSYVSRLRVGAGSGIPYKHPKTSNLGLEWDGASTSSLSTLLEEQ